jgi:superoxide dismutase, Cu-Zn family
MRRLTVLAALLCASPAFAQETATATLRGTDGTELGTVTLTATPSGITHMVLDGQAMPEGVHGFHVHETGVCEGDFTSAGGHLAGEKQHGVMMEGGPHPGDMPNIHVGADGSVAVEYFKADLPIDTLFDDDGSAVMVHSGTDDYESQPSGDAGDRIACGVIEQG